MNRLASWLTGLANDHTPDFAECLSMLGKTFPMLHDLADTEQDPQWHGEGDVAIHTDMVLAELYKLLKQEASSITGEDRQSLILSALLHDIAKPLVTRCKEISEQERVVAPKHEEIGASYLVTKLITLPLDYSVVQTVLGLVGFHHIPKRLVVKNKGYSDYLHLSLNADLALLYWLERADMQGRVCEDLKKQLDLLEQFRLFAEEYQLWSSKRIEQTIIQPIQESFSPYEQQFINGYAVHQLATGEISMAEEAVAKNYAPAQKYSHLYIMCGMSGSGKSTWIEQNLAGFEIISLDEIRKEINGKRGDQSNLGLVLQIAKKRLKKALAAKTNVVWDATNIRKDFRATIYDLGIRYGALITLVVFHLSEKSLIKNDQNRIYTVGDEVLSDQISKLEWPSVTEAHRMLIIGEKRAELSRFGSFFC